MNQMYWDVLPVKWIILFLNGASRSHQSRLTWKAMPTFFPYWKAISWTSGSEFTRIETLKEREERDSQHGGEGGRSRGCSPALWRPCGDRTYILLYNCLQSDSPSSWRSSRGSAWSARSRSLWSPAAWTRLEAQTGYRCKELQNTKN